jgi:hypothetical protein
MQVKGKGKGIRKKTEVKRRCGETRDSYGARRQLHPLFITFFFSFFYLPLTSPTLLVLVSLFSFGGAGMGDNQGKGKGWWMGRIFLFQSSEMPRTVGNGKPF